jgi:hypothetical protein
MPQRFLTRLSAGLIWLACLTWLGCSGLSAANKNNAPSGSPPAGAGIPSAYFGIVVNQMASYPLQLPYGQWRGWDGGGAQWPEIEICEAQSGLPSDSCFNWKNLDEELAAVHATGVQDVLFTASRSPQWAVNLGSEVTGSNGTDCNYYKPGFISPEAAAGQCLTPVDLNADGSGTNQMWKNWISAIATHVNDPTYLQTHTHIKMWEPWNEWYRSTIVTNYPGLLSFQGTYAQMVRLTEDMRCIVVGKGTIHNYPSAGQSTPCTATPIDSTALIVTPSSAAVSQYASAMQNFLYCNGTAASAPLPGSMCTTGNAGSQATDIIDYHLYADNKTPETVAGKDIQNGLSLLQAADAKKPIMDGETSWGDVTKTDIWTDPYAQAGFIPRLFAMYWSAGVTFNYWYAYDDSAIGDLFNPATGQLLHPQSDAWTQTYNWLVGGAPVNTPFCSNSGTIYTCAFVEASGTNAELVWDAKYGQNCSQMDTPLICGTTEYSVPAQFNKDWIDLMGTQHPSAGTVTIGANPILLEGQ